LRLPFICYRLFSVWLVIDSVPVLIVVYRIGLRSYLPHFRSIRFCLFSRFTQFKFTLLPFLRLVTHTVLFRIRYHRVVLPAHRLRVRAPLRTAFHVHGCSRSFTTCCALCTPTFAVRSPTTARSPAAHSRAFCCVCWLGSTLRSRFFALPPRSVYGCNRSSLRCSRSDHTHGLVCTLVYTFPRLIPTTHVTFTFISHTFVCVTALLAFVRHSGCFAFPFILPAFSFGWLRSFAILRLHLFYVWTFVYRSFCSSFSAFYVTLPFAVGLPARSFRLLRSLHVCYVYHRYVYAFDLRSTRRSPHDFHLRCIFFFDYRGCYTFMPAFCGYSFYCVYAVLPHLVAGLVTRFVRFKPFYVCYRSDTLTFHYLRHFVLHHRYSFYGWFTWLRCTTLLRGCVSRLRLAVTCTFAISAFCAVYAFSGLPLPLLRFFSVSALLRLRCDFLAPFVLHTAFYVAGSGSTSRLHRCWLLRFTVYRCTLRLHVCTPGHVRLRFTHCGFAPFEQLLRTGYWIFTRFAFVWFTRGSLVCGSTPCRQVCAFTVSTAWLPFSARFSARPTFV